jgi:hypothetical protein
MSIILSGQVGETPAQWTTSTRPSSPNTGQYGYNTTTGALDIYNGSSWASILMPTSQGTSGQYLQSAGAGASPTWGSAGLSTQSVQTSNFTASAGNIYPVNTTSGSITVTLPASPSTNNQITIVDYAGTAGTNAIIVNPNGNNIQGSAASITINANRQSLNFVYVDATQGWISYAQQYSAITTYVATYLVVAGAGGGGWNQGGGGGAGGLLTSTTGLTKGQVYTITIGGGGNGASGSGQNGSNGSNSSISGTGITTVTSIGGGGGGGDSSPYLGSSGGSGGGNMGSNSGAAGSGTSGQGNAGGSGGSSRGGGGGGAGAAGGSGSSTAAGGVGLQSSITGSSTYYAGGGGGGAGSGSGGTGGSGGGGAGGTNSNGTSGTANTGGGGGGGAGGPYGYGSGGSGVVILSVPTANYSGTTTGSPTVTTSGSNTIIKFTSSGSYTA